MRDIKRKVIEQHCELVEFVGGEIKEIGTEVVFLNDAADKDNMNKVLKKIRKKYPERNVAERKVDVKEYTRVISVEDFIKYSTIVEEEKK